MPRRALVAPLAFVLLATPVLAQQQGAPSELQERPVPHGAGIAAVPNVGVLTDSGRGRGLVNHPDRIPPGTLGAEIPSETGPLQGGGGPNGPSSTTSRIHADAGPMSGATVLAQAEIDAQPHAPRTAPPATAPGPAAPGQRDVRMQQQFHDLYARLHITAAQEPEWNAFARTLEANSDHMHELWASRPTGQVSALQDMRNYTQMAQAHAGDMQRLVAAFTPLYMSLSPEQKTAADQAFQQAAARNGRAPPR